MAQLNLNELIIRKTSVQLNIPESIVEKIIHYKWKSVHEAQYSSKSIEDSGLGVFKTRVNRIYKQLENLENIIINLRKKIDTENVLTEAQKARKEEIILSVQKDIEFLKTKL